jgi:predicted nucleic acid-binding protein
VKLIDTSSWVEFLRGRDSEAGLRVKNLLGTEKAAWCDLICVELWNGVRPGQETAALHALEEEVARCELTLEVWRRARKLAAASRKGGLTVPVADVVIAACASHYRLEMEYVDEHYKNLLPIAARI